MVRGVLPSPRRVTSPSVSRACDSALRGDNGRLLSPPLPRAAGPQGSEAGHGGRLGTVRRRIRQQCSTGQRLEGAGGGASAKNARCRNLRGGLRPQPAPKLACGGREQFYSALQHRISSACERLQLRQTLCRGSRRRFHRLAIKACLRVNGRHGDRQALRVGPLALCVQPPQGTRTLQ